MVLTDIVLPGELSGLQLGEILRDQKPSLRVLLATGYSRDAVAPQTGDGKPVLILNKPYTPKTLLQAVHEVLA
jgi:DNA-binding NarL/FixJ family response regulator